MEEAEKKLQITETNNDRDSKGRFANGAVSWSKKNKGTYHLTFSNPLLRADRIRNAKLGKPRPIETVDKVRKALTGRKLSAIHRQNVSEGLLTHFDRIGRKAYPSCVVCEKKLSTREATHCIKHTPRIPPTPLTGANNHLWKGGISKLPGYARHASKIRRARKKNAEGSFTLKEWLQLKAMHANLCACCGNTEPNIKLTVDHIQPLSQGGSNYISNIQPLCLSCNSRKRARFINYLNG